MNKDKIILYIVIAGALLAAPWVGNQIGNQNYLDVILGVVIIVGIILIQFDEELFIKLLVGSFFIPDLSAINIPFSIPEALMGTMIVRYVIKDLIFAKGFLKLGFRPEGYFAIGLMIILLYHGIQNKFAMKFLGSDVWGGHAYITLGLASLCYFIILTKGVPLGHLKNLPGVVLLCSFIGLVYQLIGVAFPQLGISVENTGELDFGSRWGFLGDFGYMLVLYVISKEKLQNLFLGGKLVPTCAVIIGVVLCGLSGFRSCLLIVLTMSIFWGYRDLRLRGLLAILIFVTVPVVIVSLPGVGSLLPPKVQRGLTFLPGQWDEEAKLDSSNSNEFRQLVWQSWTDQYFYKHPWIGRGFGLTPEEMMSTQFYLGGYNEMSTTDFDRDTAFAVSGNLHSGFLSIVDKVGIIGAFFFLAHFLTTLTRINSYINRSYRAPLIPQLQWVLAYIVVFGIMYLPGSSRIDTYLPFYLISTACFGMMYKQVLIERNALPIVTELQDPMKQPRQPLPVLG